VQVDQLPDNTVIQFVTIVFAAFAVIATIMVVRATRSAPQTTIDAQRADARTTAMRQSRQAKIGNFTAQAQHCVSRYLQARSLIGADSIAIEQAYTASLNEIAATGLSLPVAIDDRPLREAIQQFVNLELQERAEVLRDHAFFGSDVSRREADALQHAVPLLEQAVIALQTAEDAYVFGERTPEQRGWLHWLLTAVSGIARGLRKP
jgi:hypothetical protein